MQAPTAGLDDAPLPGIEETRRAILGAAIECMRQFGTQKMAMADVAKASGYSRATVYKHFGSRQELIDAVIDQGRAAFFADLATTAHAQDSLGDQMAAVVGLLMQYLHDDTNVPWGGLLDPLDQALIARQHGAELIQDLEEFATGLVRAAAGRGEIRPDITPARIGEWFGRLLFSSHFSAPDPDNIAHAERMVRDLCAAMAPA